MTDQIDLATAMQLFDTEVTLKYQNKMRLMGTIDERHGTTGTTLNVPISDLIEMNEGDFAPTDIPVTQVDETNVPIITHDYHLKTVVGGGQKTLFNYDKIVNHAKLHGEAGGRLDDFIKINAIYSNPNVGSIYTVPQTVGINTGINADKMADALSYLESQGVEVLDYQVSQWASALLKKSMYGDDKVVNFFYNTVKPLVNNRIQTYLDVDCRFVGENGINKIPHTGTSPQIYLIPLVDKDAIIQTYNRDLKTSITWVEQQDRWEILSVMTTGAGILQLNGIAFLTCYNPFSAN